VTVRPFDPIREIIESGRVLFDNLLLVVPNVLAAALQLVVFLAFGGWALISAGARMVPVANSSVSIVGIAVTIVVGLVLAVMATGALYRGAADALSGRPVTLTTLMAASLKYFWTILGFYFIIIVVGLAAELVVGLLTMITQSVLGVFGFLFFIPVVILAGVTLVYALPAIVMGGIGSGGAISESAEVAWTNVGQTIVLVLALIAIAACGFAIEFVMGVGPTSLTLTMSKFVVNALFQLLFVVLSALFSVRFYMLLSGRAPQIETDSSPDAIPTSSAP